MPSPWPESTAQLSSADGSCGDRRSVSNEASVGLPIL